MKVNARGGGIDAQALKAGAKALQEAAYAQRDHAVALEKGEALLPGGPADATPHLSFSERLLAAERSAPDSPVDWSALPNLRKATPAEIDAAWSAGKSLYDASFALTRVAQLGVYLEPDPRGLGSPRHELDMRNQIIAAIDELTDRLQGLGALGAVFDVESLGAMRALADAQRKALVDLHGSDLILSPKFKGPPPRLEAGRAPDVRRLPETKALFAADVATFEQALAALDARLGDDAVAASLVGARAKLPEPERPAFDRAVAGFALLADAALNAPDYANHAKGAGDRQEYRGHRVSGFRCRIRQHASKATLRSVITRAARAKAPVAQLEKKLLLELGRELGVPEGEVKRWAVVPEAIVAALADETFVPLRALNEGAAGWMRRHRVPEAETNRVVWDLTQAVVEGRFPEWRVGNAGSEAQLAHLDARARQAWLTPTSVHKPTDQPGLTFTTTEATEKPHEIFWATKVGGPSHGFDVMPHCALACFINARNQVLLAKDPRWPNFAGRAYLRLFADPQTKAPLLFLEGMKSDFPYPGQGGLLERAIVEHALEKAKAMGAKLALSPYLSGHIQDMGLPGEWRADTRYELAPSLLVEAASVFGDHDWKATEREVRSMRNPQFLVDTNAL
ncbi:MAG: hypothetical protein KC933_03955 [Myxococcales bacterium]|nr:hypothetical protein [Myxococcales bacterium]